MRKFISVITFILSSFVLAFAILITITVITGRNEIYERNPDASGSEYLGVFLLALMLPFVTFFGAVLSTITTAVSPYRVMKILSKIETAAMFVPLIVLGIAYLTMRYK